MQERGGREQIQGSGAGCCGCAACQLCCCSISRPSAPSGPARCGTLRSHDPCCRIAHQLLASVCAGATTAAHLLPWAMQARPSDAAALQPCTTDGASSTASQVATRNSSQVQDASHAPQQHSTPCNRSLKSQRMHSDARIHTFVWQSMSIERILVCSSYGIAACAPMGFTKGECVSPG